MKLFGKILVTFSIISIMFLGLNIFSIMQSTKLNENSVALQKNGVDPTLTLIEIAQLTEGTRVQMVTTLAF